jgi:CRISPR/Cas system CSM-associated protein Csm3 (group 7 of RAMP superfamily)
MEAEGQGMSEFFRVRIRGVLICESDLHLGDGDELPMRERPGGAGLEGGYNSVATGHGGLPVLPGSSLRGVVLEGLGREDESVQRLFGHVKENPREADPDKRFGSRVRFLDARLQPAPTPDHCRLPFWDPSRHTFIRHGIALDGATGTVAESKLYRHELVPKDAQFTWEIEADDLDRQGLAGLLCLLTRLDGGPGRTLGRGRTQGFGRIRW